jgi:hypothetical protein
MPDVPESLILPTTGAALEQGNVVSIACLRGWAQIGSVEAFWWGIESWHVAPFANPPNIPNLIIQGEHHVSTTD